MKIITVKENPYYERKRALNKNEKILKSFGLKKVDIVRIMGRSRSAVEQDFRNMKNMKLTMKKQGNLKRGIVYARAISEYIGKEIDENIFL